MTFDKSTIFRDRHSINLLAEKIGIIKTDSFTDPELIQLILTSYYAPADRDELRQVYEKILTADVRRRLLSRGQIRQ